MPRIYKLSRTGVRILYKVRHHKGHGIHSPFVFSYITKCIEEKTPYYAYEDIKSYLELFPEISFNESKFERLLFKTVNHFKPKSILELGCGYGINTLYLTVASSQGTCISVGTNQEKEQLAKHIYSKWPRSIKFTNDQFPIVNEVQDCILLNLRDYTANHEQLVKYLFSVTGENSFIIVDGIRTNRKHQMLWKRLINSEEVKVSMDLFHMGLLFFDSKYYKRNYKLSF
ncbi:O-methyltransferase [Dysgonomonas macrotermitis]|uniref:Methyltransferase domain-containing protein n=1 Tax=Dysgonomonas macrotermitis TaxID=1346286 RepID=A0A1M5DC95_9BACT|nr:hypothetical protein [Dysgonomonas macrotermitis]SHF64322.1 hypothetical protein SAMN05444362_108140 [Dysgonomonas macrotermitis]